MMFNNLFSDSVLKHTSSDMRKLGQRLFIFVVGGATRSEVCFHCLSNLLLLFQTLVLYYLTYELTTFSNAHFMSMDIAVTCCSQTFIKTE
jgi:hypothetical protein